MPRVLQHGRRARHPAPQSSPSPMPVHARSWKPTSPTPPCVHPLWSTSRRRAMLKAWSSSALCSAFCCARAQTRSLPRSQVLLSRNARLDGAGRSGRIHVMRCKCVARSASCSHLHCGPASACACLTLWHTARHQFRSCHTLYRRKASSCLQQHGDTRRANGDDVRWFDGIDRCQFDGISIISY